MGKVRELYSYLPYFGKMTGEDTKKFIEDSSLFHASYAEEINAFVSCFFESGFRDTDYKNTLSAHGVTSAEKMWEQIHTADVDLLKAIMTQMIREERFSTGAIASYAKDGFFERALRRLGVLYGYAAE